jgi:hypothetical protein
MSERRECFNCHATITGYSFYGGDCRAYCNWSCENEKKAKTKPK